MIRDNCRFSRQIVRNRHSYTIGICIDLLANDSKSATRFNCICLGSRICAWCTSCVGIFETESESKCAFVFLLCTFRIYTLNSSRGNLAICPCPIHTASIVFPFLFNFCVCSEFAVSAINTTMI